MRLAVFNSEFPSRVCTFFARDLRALVECGIHVDVFPMRPFDAKLWKYVPAILDERVFPRQRVRHLTSIDYVRSVHPEAWGRLPGFLRDAARVGISAVRFGADPTLKSAYVVPKAWTWGRRYGGRYDHVLAYWGSYAGSCAYLFHRLADHTIPFSIFLHAGDLYRDQVYLKEKLAYADNIITCTEFNRQYIYELFPDQADVFASKIHVYYHGLDLSEFPFATGGRLARRVLAVGKLWRSKGFDHLVRMVRALQDRRFPVELEFAGDGQEAGALKGLARSLGVSATVTFRGWLSFEDVRAAMARATVLVHPSNHMGDGMPNVIKEAMAVGTPVVASRTAGIPELLDDGRCGVLVAPGDVKGLADAVEALLRDQARRQAYAVAGRRQIEKKFDLWRNGEELARLLRMTPRRGARVA